MDKKSSELMEIIRATRPVFAFNYKILFPEKRVVFRECENVYREPHSAAKCQTHLMFNENCIM